MKKISFIKSGGKELALHGDYLRFKDDESIKDIIISKIVSVSIENISGHYIKLFWATLGLFCSLISWYFLEESIFSTTVSILSLIGGMIFFASFFIMASYNQLTIKTSRLDITLEFSNFNRIKILEFKQNLLTTIAIKNGLLKSVGKRKKLLKYLKSKDFEMYEQLIKPIINSN